MKTIPKNLIRLLPRKIKDKSRTIIVKNTFLGLVDIQTIAEKLVFEELRSRGYNI